MCIHVPHCITSHLSTSSEAERPFQRKFREDVGPPPVIQYSKRVIANLDFIQRLSSSGATNQAEKADSQPDNQANSTSSGSSVSSVSQATTQSTTGDSLRKRSRDDDKSQAEAQAMDTSSVSTTESTVTETTNLTNGRLSTSSVKFREFNAILLRQKQDAEQAAAKASDRISTIDRQLYRINDKDQKLSEVQDDLARRFTLFEDRLLDAMKIHIGQSGSNMALMETRMEKLLSFVESASGKVPSNSIMVDEMQDSTSDELAISNIDDTHPFSQSDSTAGECTDSRVSEESKASTLSSGADSMDADSVCQISSPDHKRQRSNKKKKRNYLNLSVATSRINTSHRSQILMDLPVLIRTPKTSHRKPLPTFSTAAQESRYNTQTSSGRGSKE